MSTLYDRDFYGWTQEQAILLQKNNWEEIQTLGRQECKELRNRLGSLLGHLLKWQFQPQRLSNSWVSMIREQRRRIIDLLEESPSLQSYVEESLQVG